MDLIPDFFRPIIGICKKSGSSISYNQAFTGQIFSRDEKTWLCREVDKDLLDVPTWEYQIRQKKSIMIKRYNLHKKFFYTNMKIYHDSKREFHNRSGKPEDLDEVAQKFVASELVKRKHSGDQVSNSELEVMLSTGKEQTMTRRGRKVDPTFTSVHQTTVSKFRKRHKITHQKPDMSTDARDSACLCPRMSYAFFLVIYAISRFLAAVCKWNADASTYVFLPKGAGEKVCSLAADSDMEKLLDEIDAAPEEEDGNEDLMGDVNQGDSWNGFKTKRGKGRAKSKNLNNGLPFAIKVMQLACAAGECGPACVVIAVKSMPVNTFSAHYGVQGLSWTSEIGSAGVIYFSKTRCGTREMWMDWFRKVCIPTLNKSRQAHNPKVFYIFYFFLVNIFFIYYFITTLTRMKMEIFLKWC